MGTADVLIPADRQADRQAAIRKGEISPELNGRSKIRSPPPCRKLGPENYCILHGQAQTARPKRLMTSQLGAGYPAQQWHDFTTYGRPGSRLCALERAGLGHEWKRGRGRSASHVCANVDYCHHTELADAPAARQVTNQAGPRTRVWEMGDGGEERCLASGCLSPLVGRMSEA